MRANRSIIITTISNVNALFTTRRRASLQPYLILCKTLPLQSFLMANSRGSRYDGKTGLGMTMFNLSLDLSLSPAINTRLPIETTLNILQRRRIGHNTELESNE